MRREVPKTEEEWEAAKADWLIPLLMAYEPAGYCRRKMSWLRPVHGRITRAVLLGATYGEVARAMGVSVETIRQIYFRTIRGAIAQHNRSELIQTFNDAGFTPLEATPRSKLAAMKAKHGWPVTPKLTIIRG